MFSLKDEAKTFFSRFERDIALQGKWKEDSTKQYSVEWAYNLTVSLSRTASAFSLFGTAFEYYVMVQAEKRGGSGEEEYWKAQAKTCKLRWRGRFLGRGSPFFDASLGARVALRKNVAEDDSLRRRLDESSDVGRLLRECDPLFCAVLVYSDEIPTYPFSVGAAVLDYPYEISYRKDRDFFWAARVEKKVAGPLLPSPQKYLDLLTHMISLL